MLKHFAVDTNRDLLVPDIQGFQADLSGPVNAAIEAGEVDDEEFRLLPSWTKFVAHPTKSKGFYVRLIQAMFSDFGGHPELNVDYQMSELDIDRDLDNRQRVAMMFLPTNTRSVMLDTIGKITREALPNYEVVVINGQQRHNGERITNHNAEQVVREIVEQSKPTLIIAAKMAQRSFSIPEITELYLAYDQGDEGATNQKMSRVLTPGSIDKIGRIFSLSFNPNRDDKFDAMIVEAACNYKQRHDQISLREAMRTVLGTIDIFRCTPDGALKFEVDSYLKQALDRRGVSRVLGKIVDLTDVPNEHLEALANGNDEYLRSERKKSTERGKTRERQTRSQQPKSKHDRDLITEARKVVTTIVENLDVIVTSSDYEYITDILEELDNNSDRAWILDLYGVDLEVIYYLFDNGIISQDWIELLLEEN